MGRAQLAFCVYPCPQRRRYPMAPTKTTAPTVTLKHLSANVAEAHELSKKQAEAILGGMVDLVVKHLKKGDRIRIGGLGLPPVGQAGAPPGPHADTRAPLKT